MGLKDNWKDVGKGLGKSFAGLGKSIVKSVEEGANRVSGDEPLDENGNPVRTDLRETWSKVGHSFGDTGKAIGKAAAGTAKKVVDSVEDAGKTESE